MLTSNRRDKKIWRPAFNGSAQRRHVGERYELILVDDGSTDGTWNTIKAAMTDRPNIVGIKLSRNFGHQIALTAGLSGITATGFSVGGFQTISINGGSYTGKDLAAASVNIINGGSLAWLTVALSYLGLRVIGDLSLPLAAILLRWPINVAVGLVYLIEFQFVCVWIYTVRVTILAYRSGCGGLY